MPPKVTARKMADGRLLYYYQFRGKKIPLGETYENAVPRARDGHPPTEKAVHKGDFDSLTTEGIVASAISPRPQSGVYFLIANGEIVYIGQSRQVFARICQHMKSKEFDSFYWIACPPEDLLLQEQRCIKKFRPWMNRETRESFEPV